MYDTHERLGTLFSSVLTLGQGVISWVMALWAHLSYGTLSTPEWWHFEHTWVMTTWAVQVTAWLYKKHWAWRQPIITDLPWLPQATSSSPPHTATPTPAMAAPDVLHQWTSLKAWTSRWLSTSKVEEQLRKHCDSLKTSRPIKQDAASTEGRVWLLFSWVEMTCLQARFPQLTRGWPNP